MIIYVEETKRIYSVPGLDIMLDAGCGEREEVLGGDEGDEDNENEEEEEDEEEEEEEEEIGAVTAEEELRAAHEEAEIRSFWSSREGLSCPERKCIVMSVQLV